MKTILLFCLTISFSAAAQVFIEKQDLKQLFDAAAVTGSVFINKMGSDTIICFNKSDYRKATLPASTFKICNALIGLETGVIADENFVIKWDGITRPVDAWNKDHTLASAIKVSCVPYFRELARRVGQKRMNQWLKKSSYGNMNTAGGIDKFWLSGYLRITPEQQLAFLRKLYHEELPFSKRNQDIVKHIIINDSSAAYILRAKTGQALSSDNKNGGDIGWWVGYLEIGPDVYFFSTRLYNKIPVNEKFAPARISIGKAALGSITGITIK